MHICHRATLSTLLKLAQIHVYVFLITDIAQQKMNVKHLTFFSLTYYHEVV